jgi:hypothetical protein
MHTTTRESGVVAAARYRSALGTTVAASAGPYGYTLTIWTSGAVLSHAHGIPSATDALLFLIGAVAAYALVGVLAFGGLSEHLMLEPTRAAVWGGLHFLSVGLAIGAASLVARWDATFAAWPLGGFVATALYLLASASELTLAQATRRSGPPRGRRGGS